MARGSRGSSAETPDVASAGRDLCAVDAMDLAHRGTGTMAAVGAAHRLDAGIWSSPRMLWAPIGRGHGRAADVSRVGVCCMNDLYEQ